MASTADEQDALTLLFSRPSSVSVNAASLAEIRDAIADMIVALTSASSSSDSRAAYLDEPTARLATAAPDVQNPAEPALLPDTSNSQATNSETLTDSARLAEIRDALADMIVALTSASSSSDTRAVYLDEPIARLATTAPDVQNPAEPALLPDASNSQATNSETLTDSARLAEIRDAIADIIVALTSASSSSDTRSVYLDEPTAHLLTTTAPNAQSSTESAISPGPFTSSITNGEANTTEVAKITAGLRTLYQLLRPGSLAVAENNPRAYPLEGRLAQASPLTLLSPTQQSASSHASVQPTQPLTELDEIAQRISLVSSYSAQSWPAAQATSSVANTADTLSAIQGHTPRPEPSSPAMFMATQPPPTSLSTELVNTWSTLPNVTLSGSPIVAASMPYPQDDGSQKPIATSGEPTTLLPMATSTAGSQLSTATPAQLVALPALVSSPAWPPQFGQQLLHFITRGGEQHIQMKLNPSDLGPLSVSLKMTEQGTQAQFLSAHAHVRQVLEQAIPQLREMLAEQGITLSDTFVGDQGAGDQRFEHQRGPGQRGDESDMANEHNQPHSADSLVSVSPDGRVDLYA
ncbi:flagellar hook-length control protein FliK [Vreelandella hamiltonii]|uniref:flagellar hook-length control protein FliK n=1 Tax=Vreelandella hamiltonii TaxID=502829 RepID=UPI001874C70F|nr:flagellar hook-length control protein FliK [Halomonas johnsoniae]